MDKEELKKRIRDALVRLVKQGITDWWGYHFVEHGVPYKGVPDYHATGLGGLEEEGAFLVPNLDKIQVTQAPEGRIITGTNRKIYDAKSIKRSYNIDDEWRQLLRMVVNRKKGGSKK